MRHEVSYFKGRIFVTSRYTFPLEGKMSAKWMAQYLSMAQHVHLVAL